MASSAFCLTCSSELLERNPYLTPCCSTPICSTCLARNPRLRDYTPCLRCGDVRSLEGNEAIRRGRIEVQRRREEDEHRMFEIGDDDDDPPGYDETQPSDLVVRTDDSYPSDRPAAGQSQRDRGDATGEVVEEEMELVEIRHPVSKSDTILSISRRYAADPHEILTLNELPPSTLSTQPHLLRTRRTLIISRRQIPRSKLANAGDPTLFDSGLEVPEEEEEKRERERAVKRFQLLTKTVDPGVGKAYIGLSEMDEDSPFELGSGEAMDDSSAEVGARPGVRGKTGKKVLREPGNREDRAFEAFYEDDAWEEEVGEPERGQSTGRWKTVGSGSNMDIKV